MNGRKFIGVLAGLLGLGSLVASTVFVVLASTTPGDDGWGDSAIGSIFLAFIFAGIFDANIDGEPGRGLW